MALAIVPILMIVVGILMFALAANSKVQEAGRLALAAGLIGLAIAYATHMVHIG